MGRNDALLRVVLVETIASASAAFCQAVQRCCQAARQMTCTVSQPPLSST